MEPKTKRVVHFMYVPWTGLGMYGGFRGNRWLKNRIEVFKHFVVPSLMAQSSKNFILWCSFRHEERNNPLVEELKNYLEAIPDFKTVFTYGGVCFWDDKYPDDQARDRLIMALHSASGPLANLIDENDEVLMTIQPSDDCYHREFVEGIQKAFAEEDYQAMGFTKGYMMNYLDKTLCEYNPTTIPPFFTIRFPDKQTFVDPISHVEYTGPYKSHEYIGDKLKFAGINERGFLVGTHGENISTVFNHPFRGKLVDQDVLNDFGLYKVPPIKINLSIRKMIMRKLPHRVQRKLRYIFGEKFYNKFYEFLRS